MNLYISTLNSFMCGGKKLKEKKKPSLHGLLIKEQEIYREGRQDMAKAKGLVLFWTANCGQSAPACLPTQERFMGHENH